jgi:hypothetical protein
MPNEELDTSKPDAELAVSESGADAELAASADADPELAAFDSDADADSDAESSDVEDEPAWTGYTAYDQLSYEDSMRATASDPFPVPGPADLWKEMVVPRDEEGGDKSLRALEDAEEDWEGEDPVEASAAADSEVVQQQQKKKKKKKQPKMVRALRAVRVPDSLSIREAVGLFEMWLDAGVLRTGELRGFFTSFLDSPLVPKLRRVPRTCYSLSYALTTSCFVLLTLTFPLQVANAVPCGAPSLRHAMSTAPSRPRSMPTARPRMTRNSQKPTRIPPPHPPSPLSPLSPHLNARPQNHLPLTPSRPPSKPRRSQRALPVQAKQQKGKVRGKASTRSPRCAESSLGRSTMRWRC